MFLKVLCLVAVAASVLGVEERCAPTPTRASGSHAPSEICAGQLIFEDNFDFLDHKKWQHENTLSGGGNWEFQWYSNNRTNSYVENGLLKITPSLMSDQFGEPFLSSATLNVEGGAPADRCTNPQWYGCERTGSYNNIINPTKSARVRSVHSFGFTYGVVEVRAKMPAGDWLWPAIWLMPVDNAYGSWPSSGEIDLVESRGNRDLRVNNIHIGTEQVGSTLHYGPWPEFNRWDNTHFTRNRIPGYNTDFSRYQLVWTPDYLQFSIDDLILGRITPNDNGFWEFGGFNNFPGILNPWRHGSKMAPFDQEFYLLINLAIGGTEFFPDNAVNAAGKPWHNQSPTAMRDFWNGRGQWLPTWNLDVNDEASLQVDYVRVWAL